MLNLTSSNASCADKSHPSPEMQRLVIQIARQNMALAMRFTYRSPLTGNWQPPNYARSQWIKDLEKGTSRAEVLLLLCIVCSKVESISVNDVRHTITVSSWASHFPKLKSFELNGSDWWHPIKLAQYCESQAYPSLTTFRSRFGGLHFDGYGSNINRNLSADLKCLELEDCTADISLLSHLIKQCHSLERLTLVAVHGRFSSYSYRQLHPALLTQKDSLRYLKLVSLEEDPAFVDFVTSPQDFPAAFENLESLDISVATISPTNGAGDEWPIDQVLPAFLYKLSVQYDSWESLILHLRSLHAQMKDAKVLPRLQEIYAMVRILPVNSVDINAIREAFEDMGTSVITTARYA
jgi:hypothetical protein